MEILEAKCRINLSWILCDHSSCVLKFLTSGPQSFLFLELPSLGSGGKCYSTYTMTRGNENGGLLPLTRQLKEMDFLQCWQLEDKNKYATTAAAVEYIMDWKGLSQDRHPWTEKEIILEAKCCLVSPFM